MSDGVKSPTRPTSRTIRWLAGALAAMLVFGGAVEQLLLGWIYFPVRVWPNASADLPMLLLGIVALAALTGLLHVTVQWLLNREAGERAWRFRSTVSMTLLLLLAFVAGVAMVGATHQLVWMLTGKAGSALDAAAEKQQFVPSLAGAVATARQAARRVQANNSLKQAGLAVHNLHSTYGILPPGGTMTPDGRLLHGWPVMLGNYLNFSSYGVDFSIPWNEPPNDRLFRCGMTEFINPAVPGPYFDQDGFGLCHFAANRNVLTMQTIKAGPTNSRDAWAPAVKASGQSLSLSDITDGISNTILIGSAAGNYRAWGHPANLRDAGDGINQTPQGFGGPWKGALFLFCDGQVKMVNEAVDREVLKACGLPSDGRQLNSDF